MSIVKDALMEELLERKTKSQELYSILNSAQTDIKKKIFKKKLRKNNIVIADLLTKLDKLTNMT